MSNVMQPLGRVLTFGEPMVVCVPKEAGKLTEVRDFRTDCAGAEMNTAIGLARLQVPTTYLARVGDDPFGELIRRQLRAEGVDDTLVDVSAERPTGVYFKQWHGLKKQTQVYYYRALSAMASEGFAIDRAISRLQEAAFAWVHATGITWMIGSDAKQSSFELVKSARLAGVPVSFDVNIRLKLAPIEEWRAFVRQVLPHVTWVFMGDGEAEQLYGTCDAGEVLTRLCENGFSGTGVVVKCGDKGADLATTAKRLHVDPWPVETVVDTVGAGDGFNAGFIAGMLRGFPLDECLRLGSLVGAYAVTGSGDFSQYPTWTEVAAHLDGKGVVER
ncbi:2-dehydro-3-deoxygluconokinase [Alicyclobacillus hesperidum]|uniref:2-dehydro-3-deoxygluconokinase n=1 Tax=Alicyclobacillus hesperidum TaxID=89784 RepID=A0A1H2QH10_9BACL|nr:sugar kinase [Alicyclobacillus hesperidum]SDW05914.1 2-dehydro-3-deoxygluconokinase [Alicyclobacillus hesperidum]